jgi:hypothetical protein
MTKWVQQKFWQDAKTYWIVDKSGPVVDNLTIEDVLNYCIDNLMIDSLKFLIGEFSETKEIYSNLLKEI